MNQQLHSLLHLLDHYRYLIVIVLGILIVGFIDENSILKALQYRAETKELKKEIKSYNEQYEASAKKLRDLRRDPNTIRKIARERYFMKQDDEDIYVLSDDNQNVITVDERAK